MLTCLCVGANLVAWYYKAQDDAARRLALRNNPPETVSIVAFDAVRDTGLAREVSVTAQLDPAFALRRRILLEGRFRQTLVVPLVTPVPGASASDELVFGAIVIPLARGESDAEALRRTMRRPKSTGPLGQIFRIDGQRVINVAFSLGVGDSLSSYGRAIHRPLTLIQPFDGTRAVALARESDFAYGRLMLYVSLIMAAMSALLLRANGRTAAARRTDAFRPHRQTDRYQPNAVKTLARFAALKEQESLESEARSALPPSIMERLLRFVRRRAV